ncbi:MAG: thioredoxin family protein [Pseudomonadota bacterium]|nr:thioredoxin family protein [Pseudomonadota bacterium]
MDAAFALARTQAKPVFVYWGAAWCPPCNQVKATIFNRQDFIERSRAFVPVYVDGDSAGAQKLGARFHVSGYPTMVLFNAGGAEVTRLPGEVDPARYAELLDLGMGATRPAKAVLADALAGGKDLTPNDWMLLAFYAFDTDQQQLVASDKLAPTLARLAELCPPAQAQTAMRLRLKSLAARTEPPPAGDAAARAASLSLLALLNDRAASREEADVLLNWPAEIVRSATARATPERLQATKSLAATLQRFEADPSLSRADRIQAVMGQVELARIDMPDHRAAAASASHVPPPALPPALLADVREQAARAAREITDPFERQAVITSAADLLERAGLSKESDDLLEANLGKSHSPYYLMSALAGNARRRGDNDVALRWYRRAYEQSEGPATRLQWGASYVGALVDLAPADEAAVEAAAMRVWNDAASQSDAFYERSGRSLQRLGSKLQEWSAGGAHAGSMRRLQAALATLCGRADRPDSELLACKALLTAPPKAAPRPGTA